MRRRLALAALLALATPVRAQQPPAMGGGTAPRAQIQPGEQCPPGMTEIRPRSCQAPELPAPSILDYRPRSTLVAPAHPVPRARYPVIDFHGHPQGLLGSSESLLRLGAAMDSIGVRLMIAANNISGEALRTTMATINATPAMRDRVRVLTGVDFRNVGPGWAERAVAQLEADAAAGASGIGEIGKGLGLSTRKADGSRLRIDDPDLNFGTTNGTILVSARVYYAMAKDGLFFKKLEDVHHKYKTPGTSIIIQGIWASLITMTGTFDQLTDMLIFVSWIFYGMGAYGVFVLRKKMPNAERPYKAFGYPILPAFFVVFSAFFVGFSVWYNVRNAVFGMLLVSIGIPLYYYFKKQKNEIKA